MTLSDEYKRQLGWRSWTSVLDELPPLQGQAVFDLGCGVGDQAAELVARGAQVIGVDQDPKLLREAQARRLPGAQFRTCNLGSFPDPGIPLDGLWCSFTAAYFPNLAPALAGWARRLRPGGWVAITEVDDLFAHEPVSATTKTSLEAYARESMLVGRYDFHMGRKLGRHTEQSGFTVSKELTLEDQELSFSGPVHPDVVDAWRSRFDRMALLRDFCGQDFEGVRDDFLACLGREDHRCLAKVQCCIGIKRADG